LHAGDAPFSPHYGCDIHALCTPERLENALRRHPHTTFLVPHLGASPIERVASLLDRYERLYLDTTMTLGGHFEVRPGLDMIGAEEVEAWQARVESIVRAYPGRVLFGTDFPNIPYEWDRELRRILAMSLPEEALEALLGETAARLFGIRA